MLAVVQECDNHFVCVSKQLLIWLCVVLCTMLKSQLHKQCRNVTCRVANMRHRWDSNRREQVTLLDSENKDVRLSYRNSFMFGWSMLIGPVE